MQTQSLRINLPRTKKPMVYQAFPMYIGIMLPHVGHSVVCVVREGMPIVICADCGTDITGKFYSPRILEAVGSHVGHSLKCVKRGHEVFVVCLDCNKDVVGSTPF